MEKWSFPKQNNPRSTFSFRCIAFPSTFSSPPCHSPPCSHLSHRGHGRNFQRWSLLSYSENDSQGKGRAERTCLAVIASFLESQTKLTLTIKAKEFASEKHTDANIPKILCVQDVWAPGAYFGTLLMHLCGGSWQDSWPCSLPSSLLRAKGEERIYM